MHKDGKRGRKDDGAGERLRKRRRTESERPFRVPWPETDGTTALDPSVRHRCLRLLIDAISAFEHDVTRMLMYAIEVERQIYALACDDGTRYRRKMGQIMYNVRKNGHHLLSAYTPSILVSLDDEHLARGTSEEGLKATREARLHKFETLVKTFTMDDEEGSVLCRKCRSGDVGFEFKQTRSADEPMTIFCCCRACDTRWKIN